MEIDFMMGASIGIVIATIVGLTSTGAGSLMTPALVFLVGLAPAQAVGTAAVIGFVMKVASGGTYALRKDVHWQTVRRLLTGSIPGALAGLLVLGFLPRDFLDVFVGRALGFVLILAGIATVVRVVRRDRLVARPFPALAVTITLGFATGFLFATTSVGLGSVLICILALFYPLRASTLVGTDLAHAIILMALGSAGHLLSGRGDVGVAAAVLVGAVPGALIGAWLGSAVPDRALRTALACVLLAAGVQLSVVEKAKAARPVVAEVAS